MKGRVAGEGVDALKAARWLQKATRALEPGGKVTHIYRPLDYAWHPHKAYLERYAGDRKKVLLVGMNPGPWGMGQTGVPFGDVEFVGDWLGLEGIPVKQPRRQHPKRPVMGWACHRSEGSGRRLWGYLRDRFETPERALNDLFIVNHCPLLMYTREGTNVTPDKLPKKEREEMRFVCNEGLQRMIEALRPQTLVGIGRYAEGCAQNANEALGGDLQVLRILHPSPASPLANRDGGRYWRAETDKVLAEAGVEGIEPE